MMETLAGASSFWFLLLELLLRLLFLNQQMAFLHVSCTWSPPALLVYGSSLADAPLDRGALEGLQPLSSGARLSI